MDTKGFLQDRQKVFTTLPALFVLLLFITNSPALAAAASSSNLKTRSYGNNTGVGIALGTGISGVSLYRDLYTDAFVQGTVSIGAYGSLGLSGDYALAIPDLFTNARFLRAYYGGGVMLVRSPRSWGRSYRDDDDGITFVGARMPLGVQFLIPNTPLQLAFQLEPGLWIMPGTYVFLDATLMFRFLF